jgi:Protein of unknown function (DUF1552)
MKLDRRRFLQALGLGALGTLTTGPRARADQTTSPLRVVFFVTAHGHVPSSWMMPIPSGPTNAFAQRSLVPLQLSDFSPLLQPLYPFRDRLLVVEGLAHTSSLANIAQVMQAGTGDLNNHDVAVANTLTGAPALQIPGSPCTGGARSIDQELALRTSAPGRFGSRAYGFDYMPNFSVAPFSFLGPGQATPIVADPATAYSDLMGYYVPTSGPPQTREAAIEALRPSVLDAVGREYTLLAPRLDSAGQQRLLAHQDLVVQLEASLNATSSAACNPTFDPVGTATTQFMQLIKIAFACDLTRVVTFVAQVPQCPEIGYPADQTVHGYEHASIQGATSCGAMYTPTAAQAIGDLGVFYSNYFATLLSELDSVPEGSGSLLDNTIVVWVTELGTGTHLHHDVFTVIAGAGNIFQSGRYVRYPRTFTSPLSGFASNGPAHNRLHVTLLQAMGQGDTSFGMTTATGSDGSIIPMTGPLTELLVG